MVAGAAPFPENPVLARVLRGSWVESCHRGSWVLVDTNGRVVAGEGDFGAPHFARSAVKSLQALPLLESGAAGDAGYSSRELALALSSHNAEPCHTEPVAALLGRVGLSVEHLLCGAQIPGDPKARAALRQRGEEPTALYNNCSGKHAGFLVLARHLGVEPEEYLSLEREPQQRVRSAVAEMTGIPVEDLGVAIDGCSAPTFRLPLSALALAFARVANPEQLVPERRAACERMAAAVARHPELIAGNYKRLCTDLARVTEGRLFPKIGAEAIYAVGARGSGLGLAVKIDDGTPRALAPVVLRLLARFDLLTRPELDALLPWAAGPLRNWAGLEVGELVIDA